MAIVQSPLWLENSPNHHAQGYRLLLEALTAGVSGVWPNATAVTETTGAEMAVRVKANHFLVPYTSAAGQGSGAGYNDGDEDLAIAPSEANPRIDLVVFRLNDSAMVGTPNTDDGTLEVITGTAAVSPDPPATPDDALVLAEVLVRAGTSSIEDGLGDITNVSQLAPGQGVTVCTSTSRPAAPFDGQVIFETDSARLLVWGGASWLGVPTGSGMELIETNTLSVAAASVTFSSIPDSFRDLMLVATVKVSGVVGTTGRMRFNGATDASYSSLRTLNTDGTVSGVSEINATSFSFGALPGTDAPSADDFGDYVINIPSYRLGRRPGFTASAAARVASGSWRAEQVGGKWGGVAATVSPVTSITVFPNSGSLVVGSSLSLYGIR